MWPVLVQLVKTTLLIPFTPTEQTGFYCWDPPPTYRSAVPPTMRPKNLSVNMSRKMSGKIYELSPNIILRKTVVNAQKLLCIRREFPHSSSVILYQHVYLTVLYSNISLEYVTYLGIKKFSPLYIMLCKFSKFFFQCCFFSLYPQCSLIPTYLLYILLYIYIT